MKNTNGTLLFYIGMTMVVGGLMVSMPLVMLAVLKVDGTHAIDESTRFTFFVLSSIGLALVATGSSAFVGHTLVTNNKYRWFLIPSWVFVLGGLVFIVTGYLLHINTGQQLGVMLTPSWVLDNAGLTLYVLLVSLVPEVGLVSTLVAVAAKRERDANMRLLQDKIDALDRSVLDFAGVEMRLKGDLREAEKMHNEQRAKLIAKHETAVVVLNDELSDMRRTAVQVSARGEVNRELRQSIVDGLSDDEPKTVKRIALMVGSDATTVNNHIAALIKLGVVQKVLAPAEADARWAFRLVAAADTGGGVESTTADIGAGTTVPVGTQLVKVEDRRESP